MNSRILPVLALILAIGIFFAYVGPTWSGPIAEAKVRIADDEQALAAAREYAAKENELATAYSNIEQADLDRLATFLPDSVDNVGLILDLNALAARSGLSLSSIDVITNLAAVEGQVGLAPEGVAPDPVGSVDLSISALGTYSAFQTFLAGVERSARLLDVRDLVVKGSDTGVYSYKVTLRLYWLR